MLIDDCVSSTEQKLIDLLKGKNRMEIDEILGDMQNETL